MFISAHDQVFIEKQVNKQHKTLLFTHLSYHEVQRTVHDHRVQKIAHKHIKY